jgi:plasmid maintenance system antidote protein VapI
MNYIDEFKKSGLSFADVAHELGCCELSARNKIAGKSRITKGEALILDNLFKGDESECLTETHNN